MKTVSYYVCDYCGIKFKDKYDCECCEKHHIKALNITDMKFHSDTSIDNYPDKILVQMDDGNTVWYKR